MRRFLPVEKTFLFAAFFMLIVAASLIIPAIAEDKNNSDTQIIADRSENIIRFVIDGEEVMRLDEEGLHVKQSIKYGGATTDIGVVNYVASKQGKTDAE